MSREVKFRMPLLEYGKFKEWFYWGFIDGDFITPHSAYRKCPSFQFTGLTDKNGKEIYEGDIGESGAGKKIGLVHWDEEKAAWGFKCDKADLPLYFMVMNDLKIMGNAYETPDLL